MPKATLLVLMLIALVAGVTGCARYPVLLDPSASAPAPTTAAQAPAQ